ncbi:hypothetical protein M758_10G136900 [Ceratodon purpureus]|nr:hypothetical protein M758_10G136900 [Ceratodon purpureus]
MCSFKSFIVVETCLWPGMTITAFAGYLVSSITDPRLSSTTSSAISAFTVGIVGNTYSYFTDTLPLAMIISGINLLVPGGIGVQGVASMVKNNGASSGVGFVFEMIVVALSLTIGLLIAKLATPAAMQVSRPINFRKTNLPSLMTNLPSLMVDAEQVVVESSSSDTDSEEDMAL